MQEAYIVAGFRTAVTKSKKGGFRFFRPDDLAVEVIKGLMASVPQLDSKLVDDVIVGNAVPEAEQGLQFGRIIAAKALGIEVAGITINRYCASGLESIATATAKIRSGMAECIIAGGTESMSLVPTAGWKTVPSYAIAKEEPDYYHLIDNLIALQETKTLMISKYGLHNDVEKRIENFVNENEL